MIISFFGHSKFLPNVIVENQILQLLEKIVGESKVEFYLGGYGNFDSFAYSCCKKYKQNHPNSTLVFVTPYLSETYLKERESLYDKITYPNIEGKSLKYAISYRNEYMVDVSDFIISYVKHDYGGAYKAISSAKRKGKVIYNLAQSPLSAPCF